MKDLNPTIREHSYATLVPKFLIFLLLVFTLLPLRAQVNTGGTANTSNHNKQIIGYITNWDAWKAANAGLPAQGALTQLNIDYSKYTILNYSFFGVAVDGSLHSGDHRNKNIYQQGTVQQPAELLFSDIYSSWDFHILFGEIDAVQWINEEVKQRAEALGFQVTVGGNTWSHPEWGLEGTLPLPLPKEGSQGKGLLELAHANGVKVMASIGGWSMCKHFPEMAADPVKRARFIEDCKKLINMGFDGIDLDWEYPGPYAGMNFTGSNADYANFENLVEEIRTAIGPDKLITAAMAADYKKIEGFNWSRLSNSMDYFNMMTYDFNGGWSNIAGHNAPLYPYDGAEAPDFNWQTLLTKMKEMGVPTNKINFGAPFYGRGVVTTGNATLNAPTVKTNVNIQPDGPISTASDYTNWPLDVYDGTPNHFYIKQKTGPGSGWTRYWDNQAKVPYMTNGKYFLSYDDEESIAEKAKFINANNLAGTIVWTVYGDLEFSGSYQSFGTKLKRWSNVKSPLINKMNEVFASGGSGNLPPSVSITSPQAGASYTADASITIEANASDSDGSVSKVEFFAGSTLLGQDTTAPYSFNWTNLSPGNYSIIAKAYDNEGSTSTSSVNVVVTGVGGNLPPEVSITSPQQNQNFEEGGTININATASDSDGTISKVEFYNGNTLLGEDTSSPYSYAWNGVVQGNYTINVKAFDNDNDNTNASVSITVSSTDGNECSAPAWESGRSYNGGEVVSYQGREYKAKWWTQQNPLGSTEWEDLGACDGGNPPDGDCTAPVWESGRAYNGGEVVSFEGREYKAKWWTQQNPAGSNEWEDLGPCNDGGGGNPQVAITSPTNGQSFVEGNTITINASASDSNGSITKVEFYNNGSKIGEDTTSPYTYAITNALIGSYSLTAKATDNESNSSTSSVVSVNVTTDGGCTGSNNFKVVGYMPSWQGNASAIQYDKLTHINYSFLLPNSDGSLRPLENASKLQQIVSLGHAQGVKVLIAVGGWMDGNDSAFTTLAANPTTRTAFVNNLVNFVNQYNLDGVDMDWEYPREGNEPQNFELLMQELGQAMHSRGKLLTAAVVVAGWNADGVLSGVFDDVDFLNIMAYDGPDHSTMAQAQSGLTYWIGRGLPKEKAILGVPFYSRPQAQSYASLLAQGADPYSDSFQGNNYNGITTIKAKTELAIAQGGGIMIWELSHDTTDPATSLLAAIHQVVGDPCTPDNIAPQVNITAPQQGATFTVGDNLSLTANASDSDGQVTKVAFLVDGIAVGEDNTAPYAINWTAIEGNHIITAIVTDDDNATTTSSAVSITVQGNGNQLPTVVITSPANNSSFTDGQNVTVTANASDADGSISKLEFYVDGSLIAEDTSAPFSVDWTATGGNHTLTAKATDNEGASVISSGVTITVNSDTGECDEPQYVEAGGYTEGSVVQNDGNLYECRSFPNSGWCNGAAWAYEPGVGDYWQDAWILKGECGDGTPDNIPPSVSITQPTNGQNYTSGSTVNITASASDSDGTVTKVEFYSNGSKIGEDTSSPYNFSWPNVSTGTYNLTAKAFDNENASSDSATVTVTVGDITTPPGGDLPKRILVGYWHNFNNGSSIPKLREISDKWDVINISFAIPTVPNGATMTFTPDPAIYSSVQEFKDDVALLQSRGKKVLISMGGATGAVDVDSPADAQAFSSSMVNIINTYGFDGMDIDFEGSSVSLAAGDNDFMNPTSPKLVHLITAFRSILSQYSADFVLSMAPETLYVQGGFSGYGGPSGAYLPLIYALRNEMDYIHVQHYNTGCMLGLDGLCYSSGNADFQVAMADMLLQGFRVANGQQFPALRQDQVAIGLPASTSAAGSGYTPAAEVHKALDYIIKGQSFGGRYTLRNPSGYPDFRGLMTWSINWDIVAGFGFSNPHRAYLDGLDGRVASTTEAKAKRNPFDNEVDVTLKLAKQQYVTAEVYNQIGIKVATLKNYELISSGESEIKWIADDAPAGLYFLKIRIGKETKTLKLIKQ